MLNATTQRPSYAEQLALFWREKQLRQNVPISHGDLWERVRRKEFPQPIKLSPKVTVWRVADVLAWAADPAGYRAD